MKQINVSDEDYELLMILSKQLQEQENDGQAFPYFWSPRSTKKTIGTDDDEPMVYDDCETYGLEEYADHNEELWSKFASEEEVEDADEYDFDGDSSDWKNYIENATDYAVYIVYQRDEEVQENNFSLFKGDVKGHIECNKHHLGENPHTYANTIFRMPLMESLIKAIYRLNQSEGTDINREALRFVKK